MVDVESNELFYVEVNITWTSTDTVTRQAFSEVFHPPGGIVEIHGVGFTRPAQAVGTLTDGTTNYIPEPSNFFGQIQRLNDGEIDVTH